MMTAGIYILFNLYMYGKQLIATPKKYIEEQFTIMFVGFTAFLHLFWGR